MKQRIGLQVAARLEPGPFIDDDVAVALHAGQAASEAELLAHARDALGLRMPRRIVVVGQIPRSDQGKLQRAALTATLARALGVPMVARDTPTVAHDVRPDSP